MKLKITLLLFILIFCCLFLTGCYDARGVESLAYVMALGLDVGESENIKLSLQIATLESSGGGSSSEQSTNSTVISIECSTINSGISLINNYISKKVYLAHCKAIVISEELAQKGISEHIYTLANDNDVRPDCHVIICGCEASDFLNYSTSSLENASARYYELILNSSEYTGFSDDVTFADFCDAMFSSTSEAFANLRWIE